MNRKVLMTMSGLLSAVCVFISFSLSTIANGRIVFELGHIIMLFFSCCSFRFLGKQIKESSIIKQYRFVIGVSVIAAGLLVISSVLRVGARILIKTEVSIFDISQYNLLSQIILFLSLLLVCREHLKNGPISNFSFVVNQIKVIIVQYKWLIVLLTISSFLVYSPWISPFKYDGALYYEVSKVASLYSISSLSFYGHMSQGAGVIVTFFMDLFFRSPVPAWIIANIFVINVGGISFYLILKRLAPEKKELLYVLLTATYLFSPYVLGMSGYASVDFFCANLFLPVVLFTIREEWLLQIIFGMLFSCTKEPGIIIYGCLCCTVLFLDLKKDWKRVFYHSRYYGMLAVALFWLVLIGIIGVWNAGDSAVGLSAGYIVSKSKVLFILNFAWLFVCFIIWGIINGVVRRKNNIYIILPFGAFVIFSFLLNTVNHARYADIVPICLYLLFAEVVLEFSDRYYVFKWCCASVGTVLMLLSSYMTIDPVSIKFFNSINSGNGHIVSTEDSFYALGDSIVYNRQGLLLEKAYSEMIKYGIDNGYTILVPAYNNGTYYFDGLLEVMTLDEGMYYSQTEYWDNRKGRRSNAKDVTDTSFEVYCLQNWDSLSELKFDGFNNSKRYIYSYVDGVEENISSEILENSTVIENKKFIAGCWKINSIVFE